MYKVLTQEQQNGVHHLNMSIYESQEWPAISVMEIYCMIHLLPLSKGTCVHLRDFMIHLSCVCLVCATCVYMWVCVGGAQHAGGYKAIGTAVRAIAIIHQH